MSQPPDLLRLVKLKRQRAEQAYARAQADLDALTQRRAALQRRIERIDAGDGDAAETVLAYAAGTVDRLITQLRTCEDQIARKTEHTTACRKKVLELLVSHQILHNQTT